jgi:hypothetical protein
VVSLGGRIAGRGDVQATILAKPSGRTWSAPRLYRRSAGGIRSYVEQSENSAHDTWLPCAQLIGAQALFPKIIAAELVTAVRTAMKELAHHPDGSIGLTFELCATADVDRAVEVIIINVMIDLSDQWPIGGLAAHTQHLGACADRCNVLVTPPLLIIEAQAGDGGAIRVELNLFGAGDIVAQIARERHFHPRNEVDHHSDLFTLGGLCRQKPGATREREHKRLASL